MLTHATTHSRDRCEAIAQLHLKTFNSNVFALNKGLPGPSKPKWMTIDHALDKFSARKAVKMYFQTSAVVIKLDS